MLLRALTFACVFLFSSAARADVAPPDGCTTAGQSCTNAGTSANQPGICTKTTCSRPQPEGGSVSFDCFRCFPTDAATSSSSSSSSSSSGTSSSSTSTGGSSSGDSGGCGFAGCSTAGAREVGPMALLALGALLLVLKRRR